MLTLAQIEIHAKAICDAFEEKDLGKAAEALYQFGVLLQAELQDSNYERVQAAFNKIISKNNEHKLLLSENVFIGSAEMFEAISLYSIRHAEENSERQDRGDFSLARTVPAFKLGLFCFKEFVGKERFEVGLKSVAEKFKSISPEVGEKHFSIIHECINDKVAQQQQQAAQQQKHNLGKACERAEKIILAEIYQLAQKLPQDVLEAYSDTTSKVDLDKLIAMANQNLSLFTPVKKYNGKDTRVIYPEIHTAIKQYNTIVALRSTLQAGPGLTAVQQVEQYKRLLAKSQTREALQASSKGKTVRSILINFIHSIRVSGPSAFWQQKNKKSALQTVQMIEEPTAKTRIRLSWRRK